MESTTSAAPSKGAAISGWIITALLTALFAMSAYFKLSEWEGKEAEFQKAGFTVSQMFTIGILEVTFVLLFLIPRTAFLGAILLTAYLGGAVCTHLRANEPFFAQVVFGVLVWVALGLRRRGIFPMAFLGK